MAYRKPALAFGILFCIAGFVCLLVAIVTSWWINIQVDSKDPIIQSSTTQLAHLTRNRGLFQECFEDVQASKPLVLLNDLKSENGECIRTDFATSKSVKYSSNNKMRSDLMLSSVVFLILSLCLIVFGFGVLCYGFSISLHSKPKQWGLAIKWAGIILFIAAFGNALGMAFFHAAEYLELRKIDANSDEAPYVYFYRLTQSSALQNATSRYYAWSYVLSWLAAFFEMIAAMTLFLAGVCCAPRSEKEIFEASTMNSARSFGHRNQAYDYAEGPVVPAIMQAPPQMIMEGPAYYSHFKGAHFNPQSRRSHQPDFAAQYNYDDGGWRWQ